MPMNDTNLNLLKHIQSIESYNRTVSYPSSPLNILDIPAPGTGNHKFDVEFVYNKFTPDELVNDTGKFMENLGADKLGMQNLDTVVQANMQQKEEPGESIINAVDLQAFIPRFVWIKMPKPLKVLSPEKLTDFKENYLPDEKTEEKYESYILENLNDLVDETYFAMSPQNPSPYFTFLLQDMDINQTTKELLELAAKMRMIITTGKKFDIDEVDSFKAAVNEIAQELSIGSLGEENAGVAEFINQLMGDLEAVNLAQIMNRPGTYLQDWRESAFSRISHQGLISGYHGGQIMTRMAADGYGPFIDSISSDLMDAQLIETKARMGYSFLEATFNPQKEYDLVMPYQEFFEEEGRLIVPDQPMKMIGAEGNVITPWVINPVGYFIEKFEMVDLLDANYNVIGKAWLRRDPIIFGSPSHTAGIDTKVKVGARYMYRPRTVVEIQMQVLQPNAIDNDGWISSFKVLALSKPGPGKEINTADSVFDENPPAPLELKFIWDYFKNKMTFHWAFPVNLEHDIMYFKVFRRRTIYEPFQLLALYDFNITYNNANLGYYDWVRPSLVKKLGGYPKTFYIDPEFNKDSSYIYTIVAGDAHGHWSNYAEQYMVSFDRIRNRLLANRISPLGAPEPYPNWCLRDDIKTRDGNTSLSQDKIAVSGYDQMMIAFDPEARKVTRHVAGAMDEDLQHFLVKSDSTIMEQPYGKGRYLMTITNLDRHESRILELNINSKGYAL